ncbi:serine hydrolase domain-containing protein [Pseudonocardia sp. GCM10023141]|uniref:serine hydrolase domain-containing protein n=1 Tax=Pseudonocardia sp. GCM10023141 TaxID=3252653 RepID=UPI0036176399
MRHPVASRHAIAFAAELAPGIDSLMQQLQGPGAIVYVDVPGQGTWLTARGSATIDGAPPMSTDDHMRIGSVTNSFTAEVVLQLVDQGAIGLDDPVTKYLPGVPNGDAITIRQLLGMTATNLPVYDDVAMPDPHPQGYMYGTNVQGNAAYGAAVAGDRAAAQITIAPGTRPTDVTDLPTNGVASGGMISTVGDLAIWAKALGTGALLTPATQAARTTFDPRGNYGLGLEKALGGSSGTTALCRASRASSGTSPRRVRRSSC